jgi:hypothetical protein
LPGTTTAHQAPSLATPSAVTDEPYHPQTVITS